MTDVSRLTALSCPLHTLRDDTVFGNVRVDLHA